MRNKVRFVVFGQGRSGSTLLVDLLNAHSDLHCDQEILNPNNFSLYNSKLLWQILRKYPVPYIRYKWLTHRDMNYGFKLMDYQTQSIDRTLRFLVNNHVKIIYIYRSNVFKQAISGIVASQRNSYVQTAQSVNDMPSLHLDPNLVKEAVNKRLKRNQRIEKCLVDYPHMTINYEEDLEHTDSQQETMNDLFKMLGVRPQLVSSDYVKTFSMPYEEIITNYQELTVALSSSGYDIGM